LDLAGIVGKGHRPSEYTDTAFGNRTGDEVARVADLGGVELREQPLLATELEGSRFHLDHVPNRLTRLGHLFELGRLPVVRKGFDVNTGRLAERTVVSLRQRRLIGAPKRNDRNVLGVDGIELGEQE